MTPDPCAARPGHNGDSIQNRRSAGGSVPQDAPTTRAGSSPSGRKERLQPDGHLSPSPNVSPSQGFR
jgi:hypothetical protein